MMKWKQKETQRKNTHTDKQKSMKGGKDKQHTQKHKCGGTVEKRLLENRKMWERGGRESGGVKKRNSRGGREGERGSVMIQGQKNIGTDVSQTTD
jgi:hypothetical protein